MTDPNDNDDPAYYAKQDADRNRLLLARAEALDTYAGLEHWLCGLFARLTSLDDETAGIVFYRITNFRARNTILEKLLDRKLGHDYRLFWNSMFEFIRQLDQKRNEIVHWHFGAKLDGEDHVSALRPPGSTGFFILPDQPSLSHAELTDFAERASFATISVTMFSLFKWGGLDEDRLAPWREIFARPITYPPLEAHPQFRLWRGQRTRPPPFQG
jgi:hypothetical protein